MYISLKSYSKHNKLLDNIKKEIKELDAMFISPKKEMRLEELKNWRIEELNWIETTKQKYCVYKYNYSILLEKDTMLSYVRDQYNTQWGQNQRGLEDWSSPKFWIFIENNTNNIWKKLDPSSPRWRKIFRSSPR